MESRGMGVLGTVTGIGDTVEGVTNIMYEFTDGEINPVNPIKYFTEEGFSFLALMRVLGN